jgi:hypothetical protein
MAVEPKFSLVRRTSAPHLIFLSIFLSILSLSFSITWGRKIKRVGRWLYSAGPIEGQMLEPER